MQPDIAHLSIEQLMQLQDEAAQLIEVKKEKSVDDAYNQILAIADNVGYTVHDLIAYGQQKGKNKIRKKAEPRYRKEQTGETWTGRGKQPHWLVNEIKNGAKLDDFLIKKTD
ncbi:putative DNA binding protein [Acinetobacter junii CIP 107470 = MTCC 11364]|uniref:Putative DNA binding protein n=1 Tax=Acinetobacter junii CIP 107470 = MTCC 11364 TaxID=1217666 RepID=S7WUP7_ACIJU|nr:H-NS histone family protein [Acinetobacter junii]ENV52084.1 hypothetical protein F953_00496 [Acinetobacter junii CIP 107470 = MTCC 11364]EPR86860.1 putative DNA binding protein [Acinetobacter junii CIP 107470 = MTCC 11364]